ncbi:MAG: hypothetical protein V4462_15720 [Pseudomonadota bacterium]
MHRGLLAIDITANDKEWQEPPLCQLAMLVQVLDGDYVDHHVHGRLRGEFVTGGKLIAI